LEDDQKKKKKKKKKKKHVSLLRSLPRREALARHLCNSRGKAELLLTRGGGKRKQQSGREKKDYRRSSSTILLWLNGGGKGEIAGLEGKKVTMTWRKKHLRKKNRGGVLEKDRKMSTV